ncbi:hypothetical protein VNO77_12461 [Canavalia gladiata]|uniref:Uncharacterized protein n=1 Tax=Canavalia gladiata TaxID=3824 RepID=A0AAN9M1K6_CANGL
MRSVVVQSKWSRLEEDNRDNSCYFPGCKKDANCNCEICLASINATLDLKTSLTKLSSSKPNLHCTPISFDTSILSTPTSTASHVSSSTPLIKSRARARSDSKHNLEKQKKRQNWCFSATNLLRLLLAFGFLLFFPWAVSGLFQPSFSPDVVKRVGEKCSQQHDLNGKLRFLQKELASIVSWEVSNCSFVDTLWEISQDGMLLNTRCTFYKSATEEVSIWGWPLQTAGLLTNGFSFRSYTILSGRVTQWNGGQVGGYLIRKANTSWVQPNWGASAVQLDPNTWVLEYQRSSIFENTRFYSAMSEFLKYMIPRIIGRVKKIFWLFAAVEDSRYMGFTASNGLKLKTPT